MKRLLPIALLAFSLPALADNKEIILTSDYWCPWICEDVAHPGFSVEVSKAIFEPLGYKVRFEPMAWDTALKETIRGRVTGVIGAEIPANLDGLTFPTAVLARDINVYVTAIGSKADFKSASSLKGSTFGIGKGYHFSGEIGKYIDQHYHNSKIVEQFGGTSAGDEILKKVADGKITAYVDDIYVAQYLIKKNGLESKVKVSGPFGDGINSYIAFSSKLPEAKQLADEFDAGYKKIKEDGTLTKILSNYGIASEK